METPEEVKALDIVDEDILDQLSDYVRISNLLSVSTSIKIGNYTLRSDKGFCVIHYQIKEEIKEKSKEESKEEPEEESKEEPEEESYYGWKIRISLEDTYVSVKNELSEYNSYSGSNNIRYSNSNTKVEFFKEASNLEIAWPIIVRILVKNQVHLFKVALPESIPLSNKKAKFMQKKATADIEGVEAGKQVTIYAQNQPNIDWNSIVLKITENLLASNIKPSCNPIGDKQIKGNPYFSIRNDMGSDSKSYVINCGHYNPLNHKSIFNFQEVYCQSKNTIIKPSWEEVTKKDRPEIAKKSHIKKIIKAKGNSDQIAKNSIEIAKSLSLKIPDSGFLKPENTKKHGYS